MLPSMCKDTRSVTRDTVQNFTRKCIKTEAENKRITQKTNNTSFSSNITAADESSKNQLELEVLCELLHYHIGKSSQSGKLKFSKSPYPSRGGSNRNSCPSSRSNSKPNSRPNSRPGTRAGSASNSRPAPSSNIFSRTRKYNRGHVQLTSRLGVSPQLQRTMTKQRNQHPCHGCRTQPDRTGPRPLAIGSASIGRK